MDSPVAYDAFADIYDVWCDSAPVTRANRGFYVDLLVGANGPAVELGVGNGRIAIEAARQGKRMFGVDSSTRILELCRSRAREAGVEGLLTLIQADFRDFVLPEPAALITIPFHSIGHLLSLDDKRRGLERIREQLVPGGHLVFDHFVFDPDFPEEPDVPHLRAEFFDETSGRDTLLWTATRRDLAQQLLHVVAWTDGLDSDGVLVERRYRRIDLSWITPEQVRALLERTGFEVEDVYGDFDRAPFDGSSAQQIWVARRPE